MGAASLPASMVPTRSVDDGAADEKAPRAPCTPVVVSLLNAADGGESGWEEADALAAAASFCTSHPPLVAICPFEARGVWLGMHDRSGELEVLVPPLDYEERGAGADLVEWCQPLCICEEEGEG